MTPPRESEQESGGRYCEECGGKIVGGAGVCSGACQDTPPLHWTTALAQEAGMD